MMKTDVTNREDIIKIVDVFYDKIKNDKELNYLFSDVAKTNWEKHLPKMYHFFENILFYSGEYDGNPIQAHSDLNQKSKMTQRHFMHWNELFIETVDKLFSGEKANEIKTRAINISAIMMEKAIS